MPLHQIWDMMIVLRFDGDVEGWEVDKRGGGKKERTSIYLNGVRK